MMHSAALADLGSAPKVPLWPERVRLRALRTTFLPTRHSKETTPRRR